MSFFLKSKLFNMFYKFWMNYMSPSNFNFLWNFGSMAFMCLMLQMVTGIFLAMHYKSDILLAFSSIEYISSDVQYGWLLRYLHANGASIFFVVVYLHIISGIMFGSFMYPSQLVWASGVIIFVLMIATAFFGYVLPWGQMSFWAATVIISLFSAIPLMGNEIVLWLWGGFAVDDATLNSFYSLHFFFPFIIFILANIHLMLLHEHGSNNPVGVFFRYDGLLMAPLYIVKDLYGVLFMFIFLILFVFFFPNYLGHPDNYMLGNPLVTPTHIVPEWYFLPLYAMLSSMPNKLLGVIVMALAMITILVLPLINGFWNIMRSMYFKPLLKILIIFFIVNCIVLGWMGGKPVMEPYYFMGQVATFMYFLIFFCFGFMGFIEQSFSKIYLNTK